MPKYYNSVGSNTQSNQSPQSNGSSAAAIKLNQAPREKGGKEGEGGGVAFSLPTNAEFLSAVFFNVSDGATPLVTGKDGDPGQGAWIAHSASELERVCVSGQNTYFNCGSVRFAKNGGVNAKKTSAVAYHALVLDDVGTKSKALPDGKEPTWLLETSPGNFQVGFVLVEPELDHQLVEDAQRAIADAGYCDRGALGFMRWARLPNGVNGKPQHQGSDGKPFKCRLTAWSPERRYALEDVVQMLAGNVPAAAVAKSGQRHRSSAPPTRRVNSTYATISSDVFTPAASENPVVTALKAGGLYKKEVAAGQHSVRCPWVHEHTDQIDNGSTFFEPSALHPLGGFKCHHSHGDRYRLKDLLKHLDLTRRDVRNKPCIRVIDGELQSMVDAAQLVLAGSGEVFQSGGMIVKVTRDLMTGAAKLVMLGDADLTLLLSREADWERCKVEGEKLRWSRSNPAPNCVRLLAQSQDFDHLPNLKGIARQPILNSEGKFVSLDGYDPASQLYCAFEAARFKRTKPTRVNAESALARLQALVDEFPFASENDKAAALSGMFTAVTRPSVGRAPAFHVRAPAPGTGKSYLCDVLARFAGPGEPAKVSYPRTEEEATKLILASLIQAPAVLDFDDMTVDWRPFGAVNRLLTASTMTDRILGSSKMATVGTDVLVLGSGNNTGPAGDLMRRVIVIDLDSRSESPATLRYSGDPLREIESKREQYVADVMLIIEAWVAAGSPVSDISPIATYGSGWTSYCRQPLIWLGVPDPAASLLQQLKQDPDLGALTGLLSAWYQQFGDQPKTLRSLLESADTPLELALQDLPFIGDGPINRTKLGYYLKRNANRPIDGLRLEKADCSERNAWRVVRFGLDKTPDEAPPLPPSPPSFG